VVIELNPHGLNVTVGHCDGAIELLTQRLAVVSGKFP
jgi:hypothetical protein